MERKKENLDKSEARAIDVMGKGWLYLRERTIILILYFYYQYFLQRPTKGLHWGRR